MDPSYAFQSHTKKAIKTFKFGFPFTLAERSKFHLQFKGKNIIQSTEYAILNILILK